MSDSENRAEPRRSGQTEDDENAAGSEPRQAPRLSPEQIEQLEGLEEIEDFMEEPPSGSLGVISDQDLPGEPG